MTNDETFPAAQCGVVNVSGHNSQNELLFVHSRKKNWKVLDEKIQTFVFMKQIFGYNATNN